jgi:hypothetical protein
VREGGLGGVERVLGTGRGGCGEGACRDGHLERMSRVARRISLVLRTYLGGVRYRCQVS